MNQNARSEAEKFASAAFNAKRDELLRSLQSELKAARASLAARGLFHSGAMIRKAVELHSKYIEEATYAKADSQLEGFELHGIEVDQKIAEDILNDCLQMQSKMIADTKASLEREHAWAGDRANRATNGPFGAAQNALFAHIERKRLMRHKATGTVTNVYHVNGYNSRVNINSTDSSTNSVTISTEQVFAKLQQVISEGVEAGSTRDLMLSSLDEMRKTEKHPTFAQRYTDFISCAADHMTLVAPFIPALSEILATALRQ
jgi:hypothetical protein